MKQFIYTINCLEKYDSTKRSAPFLAYTYVLSYKSDNADRELIDTLCNKALLLSKRVNAEAANGEVHQRDDKILLANAIAGVFSEYFWRLFLNEEGDFVQETEFEGAAHQIDLRTIDGKKTIEVRSSFPRNSIEFAICHPRFEFDILGPYSNSRYKPGEIIKDFYVRTLFHLESAEEIIESVKKDGFRVFLTGGATRKMMTSKKLSKIKTLQPEDSLNDGAESSYRVVPFSRALDTFQIRALICKKISD